LNGLWICRKPFGPKDTNCHHAKAGDAAVSVAKRIEQAAIRVNLMGAGLLKEDSMEDDDVGTDRDAIIEVDDVGIVHTDASV